MRVLPRIAPLPVLLLATFVLGLGWPAQAGSMVAVGEALPRYLVHVSADRNVSSPAQDVSLQAQIDTMLEKAKAGDSDAQFQLALLGLSGRLGQNNTRDAVRLLGAASNAGHVEARILLATLFLHGRGGVVKDEARALQMYREQADAGDPRAQNALGQMLLNGQGGSKNAAEAVRWFTRAAEQNLPAAQSNLGYAYAHGEGVAPDKRRALEYFEKAAAQGVIGAQHNVAWMYQHGEGTPANMPKAFEWYRRASEAGYHKSQFNLGLALMAHVQENEQARTQEHVVEAIKWLILAASGNDATVKSQAQEALHAIAAGVGPQLVTEAGEAARMWGWQRGR